jgi:hypothetical protein
VARCGFTSRGQSSGSEEMAPEPSSSFHADPPCLRRLPQFQPQESNTSSYFYSATAAAVILTLVSVSASLLSIVRRGPAKTSALVTQRPSESQETGV